MMQGSLCDVAYKMQLCALKMKDIGAKKDPV